MRKVVFVLGVVVAAGGLIAWRATSPQPNADEAAVRAAVDHYMKGIMLYSKAELEQAFWSEAHIMASSDRRGLYDAPFNDWVGFTERDAPSDTSGYVNTIVSVDIAGNAAMVKTDLKWPNVRYIDYLSLLKIDGEWKIVNKAFYAERKNTKKE